MILFSIPSDNGLSMGGIIQAEQLRRSAANEKERLGQMRMKEKLAENNGDLVLSQEDKMISDFLRASTILSSPQVSNNKYLPPPPPILICMSRLVEVYWDCDDSFARPCGDWIKSKEDDRMGEQDGCSEGREGI